MFVFRLFSSPFTLFIIVLVLLLFISKPPFQTSNVVLLSFVLQFVETEGYRSDDHSPRSVAPPVAGLADGQRPQPINPPRTHSRSEHLESSNGHRSDSLLDASLDTSYK